MTVWTRLFRCLLVLRVCYFVTFFGVVVNDFHRGFEGLVVSAGIRFGFGLLLI